jgi:ribonuclease P protein component
MINSNHLSPQEELQVATPQPSVKANKFPKSARVLTNSHYRFIQKNSARHLGDTIQINFRQGRASIPKLGITVSKKFGKAHDRNRFKRVVREAFRELIHSLPPDLEMNVSPRRNDPQLCKQAILLELQNMLSKIIRT